MTFTTQQQYESAVEKLMEYEKARNAWQVANNNKGGIPVRICETFPFASEVTNELRSAIEVYEFCANPPAKYFLYINEKTKSATTWTGDALGTVTFGHEYMAVFGDKRQSVRIKAINGKTYSGTYYKSAGNYARVKTVNN